MDGITDKLGEKIGADVVALDKADGPVLFVQAKARVNSTQDDVYDFLGRFSDSKFPFAMFADLTRIMIFGEELADPRVPIIEFETSAVLSYYEPAFGRKRIFSDYFETLIEAWLRDFAFHWKSERPPAFAEFESLGLVDRLAGGMTFKGAALAVPPLCRD